MIPVSRVEYIKHLPVGHEVLPGVSLRGYFRSQAIQDFDAVSGISAQIQKKLDASLQRQLSRRGGSLGLLQQLRSILPNAVHLRICLTRLSFAHIRIGEPQ
jgi:hypothetical protein